jgi:hypothetical protein
VTLTEMQTQGSRDPALQEGYNRRFETASVLNEFHITQLPGESGEEFAQRVAQFIQDDYERKAGGLGG